jgi:hypothetical protein
VDPSNPSGKVDPASLTDVIEHLRQGTREQYESEWTLIVDTTSHTFTHNLGEVPWVVDVIGSKVDDGKNPVDRNADVTVVKDDEEITITNNVTADEYFKVRAT